MKKQLPVLVSFVFTLLTFQLNAQLVSGNAFLQGNYVEVGIGPCGNFASTVNAPAGYHARGGPGTQLGFVADPAQDGWSTGTPNYIGDYFLPGSPEEGWGLTVNGTSYNNNQICGTSQIPGSIINYSNSSGQVSATWQGGVAGLNINARTYMPTNALYFITEVTVTNTSAATINNVYYMRNVDPDMEQPLTTNFATNNAIVYQNPDVCNRALVSATGQTYNSYLGLGSIDSRAKVTYGGFGNRSALDIWNGTGLSQSGSLSGDIAISISFNLGNLAPNQSTTFAYAYILSSSQLTQALAATNINFSVNGVSYTTGNTANICSGSPIPINLTNTGTYTSWSWSPATGLNTTSGTSVIATAASPIVYTATGTGPCGTVNVTINLNPVITPVPGNAGAITGPVTLGPNQTGVTFSISPVANATSYNWTLPPGAIVTSGSSTSNSITITTSGTSWCGNVSVQPVNVCGTGASSSLAVCIAGITTGSVTSPLCTGSVITVPFTVAGTFNAGNIFTAQLSDASGSFASPVSIGTLSGTSSGSISATVPSVVSGTGYRIRVVGSNPSTIGSNNGANISITQLGASSAASTGGLSVCAGQTNVYGVTAAANATSYAWALTPVAAGTVTSSARTATVQWSSSYSGAATLSCTPANSCGNGTPVNFNVTVNSTHGVAIATYPYQGTANGKHYYLSNGTSTWATAKTNAESQCTNLVAISSATEQTYVQNILNSAVRWQGLTDEITEGTFVNVNAEPTTYTNWNAGQPDNAGTGEDYAEIQTTGLWNDGPGTGPYRAIMERTDNESLAYVSVSDSAVCAGATFTATFSNTGVYDIGNVFKVEFSDASASFAAAVTIGSATASSVGIITCTVPAGTTNGTGYQIRLISSSPIDTLLVPVNFLVGPTSPSFSFSGSPFIRCQDAGTSSYSVPVNPDALTYNWSITPSSAGTLNSVNNTVTVTWSSAFGGNATLGYTISTACTTSTSASAVVAVIPWQPSSVFTETVGTVSASTTVAAYETANGFDNDGYLMSASATTVVVNNTSPSTGYTGASGGANIQIPSPPLLSSGRTFTIEGINTTGLNNLVLRYGVLYSSIIGSYSISYSTDGTTFTALPHSYTPSSSNWQEGVVASGIPQAANLRIRFTGASLVGGSTFIDDIRLTYNNNAAPVIVALGPTELCPGNSVTLTQGIVWPGHLWSNGATTPSISPSTAGIYNMKAIDSYGCQSPVSNNITVTGDITPPTVSCKPATVYVDATGNASITVNDVLNNVTGHLDSVVFNSTGSAQTFTVPAGITTVTIKAWGAQGGDGQISGNIGVGGKGGYATGNLAVTPGQTLNVYVGGRGTPSTNSTICCGGFNGGGNAYGVSSTNARGGGGGASDVRVGGTALANRVLVAGGGGGGCWLGPSGIGTGGGGGGLTGIAGNANDLDGGGGTQIAGGANGCLTCCGGSTALVGSLGQGGGVAPGCTNTLAGGGGGYYGGGAGNNAGGGSSYIGGVTAGSTTSGVNTGFGKVVVYWTTPSTPATSDNCAVTSVTASKTTFNCTNLGNNNVTVTASDASANSATCNAVVTVVDTVRAVALCQNVTLPLDTLCNATLTVAQVNNGSADNCSIASMVLSKTSFNATNLGANNVLLTVTDGSGNINGCFSTVTVVKPAVTPTVTISATPGGPVCTGTSIAFGANITYGGNAPTYSWKKNGVQVATTPTYSSSTLVNGDQIRCDITSSIGCLNTNTASSNTITVAIVSTASWYLDADADGHYLGTAISSCTSPGAGYTTTVIAAGDCNDNDNTVWQSSSLYIDADNDGYDNGTAVVCYGASVPSGYKASTLGSDCNDNDATKHANFNFYADADGDGFGAGVSVAVCAVNASTPPTGYSLTNTDCAPLDNTKWQSATLYIDADADGYTNGTSVVCYGASIPSGYTAASFGADCNDNDAAVHQVVTWYLDTDGDGHYLSTVNACNSPGASYTLSATALGDCDDNDNTVWQSALVYADNDGDGYGAGSSSTLCFGNAPPSPYVLINGDCDDNNSGVNPGALEINGNNIDDNCDGNIDEGFPQLIVTGNGIVIGNHSTTTSAANLTFYGNVSTGSTVTHNFRIINSGINNTTGINIGFASLYVNNEFTISIMPSPGLGPYDTTEVQITFHPLTAGLKEDSFFLQTNYGDFVFRIEGNSILTGPNTWLGNTDDWATASNWSYNVVPSACGDNVLIPNLTIDPVVHVATSVGNITLQDGATLTLDQSLNVCGNVTGGTSTVAQVIGINELVLGGASPQTVSGKLEINTLRLMNPTGANILASARIDIFNEVDLQLGNLNIAPSAILRFRSTSSNQIAILDDFSSGYTGTISGNITAQRAYDAAAYQDAHYFGSPVTGTTAANFGSANGSSGFVTATGNCDETALASGSLYGNVYSYDESNGASCNVGGWKVEAASNSIVPGKGYSVRKVGAGILNVTGAPNLNSSYTQSGTNGGWANVSLQGRPTLAGWTMVSNPYLATLDLNAAPVPAGYDAQYAVWNATGPFAGTYTSETVIAPFQAFFVRRSNAGGPMPFTINGNNRSKNPQQFQALNNSETMTLNVTNTANGLKDKTTVGFSADATTQFDSQLDGVKLSGALTRHTLYSYNNDPLQWYSKNMNTSIAQTSTVNVGFEPGVNGNYSMNFDGLQSFDPTSYITLEDKKLNIFHDVRSGDYSFTASTTDNWNRFVLHFTPKAEIKTVPSSCEAYGQLTVEQPGSANWNYTIQDLLGTNIGTGILNNNSPLSLSVPAGVYTITLVDANNYTVVKNVQVTGVQPIVAAMQLSATTVEAGQPITFTDASNGAANVLWNFGDNSSSTLQVDVHAYSEGIYTVSLTVINADGCSSTTQQTITVNAKEATGISNSGLDLVKVWSNGGSIYADFSKMKQPKATIYVYNLLGQQLFTDHVESAGLYTHQFKNLDVTDVLISIVTKEGVSTRKLFIANQ
ncbi:MAG: glycine-rich protein [Chitinophagales bacterium]